MFLACVCRGEAGQNSKHQKVRKNSEQIHVWEIILETRPGVFFAYFSLPILEPQDGLAEFIKFVSNATVLGMSLQEVHAKMYDRT